VEELQRRFLQSIEVQTGRLAQSSARVEVLTKGLETTVGKVGVEIEALTKSSKRIERLTKWLIGLTVALFLLTALQVALVIKDQFAAKPISPPASKPSPAATSGQTGPPAAKP
jgi:hypothetical protein